MEVNENDFKVRKKFIIDKNRSVFSKFGLPFLLYLSFIWLNLYSALSDLHDVFYVYESYENLTLYLLFSVSVLVLIEYIIFELIFFVYRLFLGFSIYSFLIPKNVLLDKFRLFFIFRNIILGFIFNLRFFFPYINTYLCAIELIMNFIFIIALYFDLKKNYVDTLVAQHAFRMFVIPIIIYEVYKVITLMVGVL